MYIVLVEASADATVAAAPLTGQSSWTIPAGQNWSLHLWDGAGEPTPPSQAAAALADICGTAAFVYWWSHVEAGYALFHKDTLMAEQTWPAGPTSPVTPEDAAAELDRVFRRPFGYREELVRHLAESHEDADAALRRLLDLLGLDHRALALDQEGLTIWAAAQPGVRRTPVLSGWQAMRHLMREAPPTNALQRVERERPTWYRLLNLFVGLGMGVATVILFLNWRWGQMSGWWALLGALTTVAYLASARPGRKR